MKTTKTTDQFNRQQCLEGFCVFLTANHTYVYEMCFHLTFKRALKSMSKEFNDPNDNMITDLDFFEDIDDPIVQHCFKTLGTIIEYQHNLLLRKGFDTYELLMDEKCREQAKRYMPVMDQLTRRKSYRKIALAYERFLKDFSNACYSYACVLSAGSYKIPSAMRTNVKYSNQGSFRLLSIEDYEVHSLTELISAINAGDPGLHQMIYKWQVPGKQGTK